MFPLRRRTLPKDAAELREALAQSLREAVTAPPDFVTVKEGVYPELDEISVRLDGADLKLPPPRPPQPRGMTKPALRVARVEFSGKRMSIQNAHLDLVFQASNVAVDQDRDENDDVLLVLQRAAAGKIEIKISKQDLEQLLRTLAREQAEQRGVAIENLDLAIEPRGPRSFLATVDLAVRKGFFRAKVAISGQLQIDDKLLARVSNLSCDGSGALGSLACGVLTPFLQRANNRSFSLMALPMGEARLRDVQIETGDQICVQARFGSPA